MSGPDASSRASSGPVGLRVRIVGPGRVGGAFLRVGRTLGWHLLPSLGRADDVTAAAAGADVVLITTPDREIAPVATAVEVCADALVVHTAGSLGPGALGDHPRRGVLHPLVSIPDAEVGAARLRAGAWFAVDADTDADRVLLESVVRDLGGHAVRVGDADRATYHAAASVASNHLVALLGQVERLAASCGVPLEAFLSLASQTLDGVVTAGPAAALTGPVRRGDWDTVARYLDAIEPAERPAYAALAEAALRVSDPAATPPAWLTAARCASDPPAVPVDPATDDSTDRDGPP